VAGHTPSFVNGHERTVACDSAPVPRETAFRARGTERHLMVARIGWQNQTRSTTRDGRRTARRARQSALNAVIDCVPACR
jgi:hypothetical protein